MERSPAAMLPILFAAALSFSPSVQQPRSARAAMDGLVTQEEALRILENPLASTIGRVEAERVQRVAVANALLEHCRLDWGPLFRLLTAHHRRWLGRSETEMTRITVWHGFWQGRALAELRRDRPTCDEDMRRAANGNAARQVETFAPGSGS